jgi:hypothetical protein
MEEVDMTGDCRIVIGALIIAVVAGVFPGHAPAQDMPNGRHYNLNIIAVPPNNRPPDSNPSSNRHTIIAPLNTQRGNVDCRILLTNGGTTFDFQVVDGFCLDGDASFVLPDPDPDNTGIAEYQVWLALAGKPGGGANLTTCKVDPVTNEDVCSLENTITISGNRDPGKPKWVNVTKQLLTLCLDTDGDSICDTREFLFDDSTIQYLWQYDNFGNRIAKLRFYPVNQSIGLNP